MLIGIAGAKNSGKDTVGQIIIKLTDGRFKGSKMADPLKNMVCILLSCSREQLEDRTFKETPLSEEWWSYQMELEGGYGKIVLDYLTTSKEELSSFQGLTLVKPTPRSIMETLANDYFRGSLNPNTFINIHNRELGSGDYVVTDIRYDNEGFYIEEKGGFVIELLRNRLPITDKVPKSERGFVNYIPRYVVNGDLSLVELEYTIKNILTTEGAI